MLWLESTLKRLAEGEFVCNIRFPDEYEVLSSPEGREKAEAWLGALGYRLCQLEEDGAYFMAYGHLDQEAKTKVRDEIRNLRDRLQPAVRYLETVRQLESRGAQLQPGSEVALSSLMETVRGSAPLERRLEQMKDVFGSRTGEAAVDRLERILSLLEADGYLHLANPSHKVYVVTGKVTYLYQLLAFMAEHTPQMSEGVDDKMEEQMDLSAAARQAGHVQQSPAADSGAEDASGQ
jgi:hypothetical protein